MRAPRFAASFDAFFFVVVRVFLFSLILTDFIGVRCSCNWYSVAVMGPEKFGKLLFLFWKLIFRKMLFQKASNGTNRVFEHDICIETQVYAKFICIIEFTALIPTYFL